jgi:hypothetical protein
MKYRCVTCGEDFDAREELVEHETSAHPLVVPVFRVVAEAGTQVAAAVGSKDAAVAIAIRALEDQPGRRLRIQARESGEVDWRPIFDISGFA